MLHRGEVVALRAPRDAKGREQTGQRYAVVVQSDEFEWLSTVVVAPTSISAQRTIFRPEITVRGKRTRVLVDQLSTVDRGRLGRPAGRLSADQMDELETSLIRILGVF